MKAQRFSTLVNNTAFRIEKRHTKQSRKLFQKPIWCHFGLAFLFLIILNQAATAQDVLVGLTSANGPGGGGTAFSIKTAGTNFNVHKAFLRIGTSPQGDLVKGFDGNFYGMISYGDNTYGTIFKMTPAGVITVLKNLDVASGIYPYGSLVQGKDSAFYGMTYSGGSDGSGTIFKITSSGAFKVLKNLTTATGGSPFGNLIQGTDGALYGMTSDGGTNGYGTIFKITTGGSFAVLKNLDAATTGGNPHGSLIQGSDGAFYGMTNNGGAAEYGTIFRITTGGTVTILKNLDYYTTGGYPFGSLVKGTDGAFYGMTNSGGTNTYGTIFRITTAKAFSIVKHLAEATGSYPEGSLVLGTDGAFYGMTSSGGTYNNGTVFRITTGGTVTVLRHLKAATDGSTPYGSLCKNSDGFFYGMTYRGGSTANGGTIFKLSNASNFTVLHRLPDDAQGITPQESLVQAADGFFYGTASEGGVDGYGAIYKLCSNGSYTVVKAFTSANGAAPQGSLVQGTDGNFYGTTYRGGTANQGTLFKLALSGTLTVLKNMDDATGSFPAGSLVQGSDGALYGMTNDGGTANSGTIFKYNTATNTFTVLKNFDAFTTGGYPQGGLVQGADGALYGMTAEGGTNGGGTIFKITTSGGFSILKHLGSTTGNTPTGNLIKGTDGAFYGLTSEGGSAGYGTLFKLTTSNVLTVLKSFSLATTGGNPQGSLVQGSDGTFYGMTAEGGTYKGGTIFKYSTVTNTFTVLRHLNPATDGSAPLGGLVFQKPVPVVKAQSVTTNEDVAKAITLTATGGTPLTYTISTAPKNGTVSGTGATYTYKPKTNFYGKDSFYVTATWGCQASAPAKINITVAPVNDAPVLAAIGNKTIVKGKTLTFTATATDPDAGQTKIFSLITPPSGATIGASTGAFSWTPAATGTFTFKVRVTDNGSPILYDEETITVTVTAALMTTSATLTQAAVQEPASHTRNVSKPGYHQLHHCFGRSSRRSNTNDT